MPLEWNAVYLGTRADIDSDERSNMLEKGESLLGAYGDAKDELANHIARFTINDADRDNRWDRDNEAEPEKSTYEMDGETHTAVLDSIGVYQAEVTFLDGTTGEISAVILQMMDGKVFLAPEYSDNDDNKLLQSQPIQSLTLKTVLVDNAVLVANRQDTQFVVCFDARSRILTPDGPRPAGDIAIGDQVTTRDHGDRAVLWTGRRRAAAEGAAAPIAFDRNAIGRHGPFRVSPQHRMLLTGWRAELLFGAQEVLIPAAALVNDRTIRREPGGFVDYVHFLFDRHEIIFVEGAPSESLHLGPAAAETMSSETLLEALTLFPQLAFRSDLARPAVRMRDARALAFAR